MLRQFIEMKIRAFDADALTLKQLETCAMQMQELALDTNPHNVEHSFCPMPGMKIERVLAVNSIEITNQVDERKRLTFSIFLKLAMHVEDSTQIPLDHVEP